MRHRTKFTEDRSNRSGDMADLRFFKMAAASMLDFGNVKFLMVGTQRGSNCVCVPNFGLIAQNATDIWRFLNFSTWRPSIILDFNKLEFLNFRSHSEPNMRERANFREHRSNHCGYMADFRFLKMDCFYACWDHPWRVLGGLCDCAKFGGNRCRNFDCMHILIFGTLRVKMPIYATKIEVFGEFCPQNGEQYEREPQKAHIWAENTSYMTYRSSKSVHVCGLGASRRIKQKCF